MTVHVRYVRVLLIALLALLAVGAATAVAVDPFRVFGVTALNARNAEPNTRYLKIQHLKGNPGYDGFVFGTSRSNAYRPALLNELTGLSFYNLNAQSETPAETLPKLRWLIANLKPKMIVIGLDFDELDQPLVRDPTDLQRREHPDVAGVSAVSFFYQYFWPHPRHLLLTIYGNFVNPKTWYRFDLATGRYRFPFYEKWMQRDPAGYVAQRLHTIDGKRPYRPNPGHMTRLGETIELARRNGIETVVVINPTNHRLFKSYDPATYAAWLRETVEIAGRVWDFSGLNAMTRNDRLYYDVSHFTETIGDHALRRIFAARDGQAAPTDGFGVLLTARNVGERSRAMAELLGGAAAAAEANAK